MNVFRLGILLAIASVFHVSKVKGQTSSLGMQKCDTVDIVFMVDYSTSFKSKAWRTVSIISNYIDSLNIDSMAVKVGFNWFDSSGHPLGITANKEDIKEELRYVRTIDPSHGTALTEALERLWMMFYISSDARQRSCKQSGVQRCVILISDGGMIDYESALKEANALKANGIMIRTISIGSIGPKLRLRLEKLATDPAYYIGTDFEHLEKHLLELRLCF